MGNFISTIDAETLQTTMVPVLEERLVEIRPVIQDVRRVRDTARHYFNLAITCIVIYMILFLILFVMQVVTLVAVTKKR